MPSIDSRKHVSHTEYFYILNCTVSISSRVKLAYSNFVLILRVLFSVAGKRRRTVNRSTNRK